MQGIEKTKNKREASLLGHVPKGHVMVVSALAAGLAVFSMLPSEEASAKRQVQQLEIPALASIPTTSISEPSFSELTEVTTDAPVPAVSVSPVVEILPIDNLRRISQKVKSGDSLSIIFKRAGLSDRHMMELLAGSAESKTLTKLLPGHELEFALDTNNQLQSLKYVKDRLNSFSFLRTEAGFVYEKSERQPDIKLALRSAEINNSLFTAGKAALLDDKVVMELANVFGWDVDFALDIRKGDSFTVLFEETFLDGEKIGNGNVLAAEFVNQGQAFRAVRYVNENGETNYYTPTGESMRKAFLRAPLDFRRISSNFNPRRLHPVLKTLRPHRGIDYAADVGTPVWASGDGRVIASSYSKANGNYVVIQHGNGIQTKYLHLSKRYVNNGQRVRQQQRIGSVGATGLATGPHLHYEFLINGVHRNPRTVVDKLPKAESVSAEEMARFLRQTQPLLAELSPGAATLKYASSGIWDAAADDQL